MKRHANVASEEQPPKERQSAEPKDVYSWALGTRPSGQPHTSPHVRVEQEKEEPDLYEIARRIRGEK